MFPSVDQAISQFEGFGVPGTIATRQNNPGNLTFGPFAESQGATGPGAGNIAIFPNSQTGFNAMDQLIQHYASQGYNIQDLINTWSPPGAPGNSPRSTQNYTDFVAQKTGATPGTPVSALQTGQDALSKAGDILKGISDSFNPTKAVAQATQAGNILPTFPSFSFGRIVAIGLGLILIFGSILIFAFQGAVAGSETILGVAGKSKTISKAAEVVALAP